MRRRHEARLRELRQRHSLAEPSQAGRVQEAPAAGREEPGTRAQALLHHRLALVQSIRDSQAALLRDTASELDRTRQAEIITASGEIRARITRFRWGDDVLELTRSQPVGRSGSSMCRLRRSGGEARTAALIDEIAHALAALEPWQPPPETPAGEETKEPPCAS